MYKGDNHMKICVCTICKNESKHVKQWVDSMREADYLAVLDTGSTDDTVDLFRKEGIEVNQTSYDRFRWDVARNDSMKFIPKDADVVTFVDLDETLEPGWRKIIEDNWIIGKHTQAKYKLSQDNPESGLNSEVNTWMIENSPKWYWRYPIWEEIFRDDINEITPDRILDLRDKFVVHHFPDTSKPRDWYNPLIEERVKENPNQMSRYYYAMWLDQNPNTQLQACNEFVKIICEPNDRSITKYERAEAARRAAIIYHYIGDDVSCENCLKRGLVISPTSSILYVEYAKLKCIQKDRKSVEYLMNKAIEYKDFGWFIKDNVEENLTHLKNEMLEELDKS
jgi:glycosyltransferase involved in cell wall biosynthesis